MNRSSSILRDGFEYAETRRTLPMALLRAREAVMERFRPMLNEIGITEQQWRVLRVVDEAGEIDASKLAVRASVLAPSLTRILKTLETRGFITATKDSADARRVLVALTDEGRGFIRAASIKSAAVYAEIEAKLGPRRVEHLLDEIEYLLQKLE